MAATKPRCFLDSNVVLYLLSDDAAKADRAEALLQTRPLISAQVLNEVTHVCVRKLKMGWDDIAEFLTLVRSFCSVLPLTEDTHDRARRIAESHQLSFYDACIVAAAAGSACLTLYSEGMNHGQVFEGSLTIQNPFLEG